MPKQAPKPFGFSGLMLLLPLVCSLLLPGCIFSPSYVVKVDALALDKAAAYSSYVLHPHGHDKDDLLCQEFAAEINRALASRGFTAVEEKHAQLAVQFSYARSAPYEVRKTRRVPIYGTVEMETVTESKYDKKTGKYVEVSKTVPKEGIVGYKDEDYYETDFASHLVLTAFELSHSKNSSRRGAQVWRVSATYEGTNDDLRVIFPALATAAASYAGQSSGKTVRVEVDAENPSQLLQ